MASITIRDVPEETRAELAARAARSGRSMQEYLRRHLVELADRPDQHEVWERIRNRVRRTESRLSAKEILDAVHVDRR
jgi:plasmid stability protein